MTQKFVRETEYYVRLGVQPTATSSEIKKAYHQAAMKYHPDKNKGNPDAANKFKDAKEAYETLSDEEKRALYDAYGKDYLAQKEAAAAQAAHQAAAAQAAGQQPPPHPAHQPPPGNMHDNYFKPNFNPNFRPGPQPSPPPRQPPTQNKGGRTKDMIHVLLVSLEDFYNGVVKQMKVSRKIVCKFCQGNGLNPKGQIPCNDCRGSGRQYMQNPPGVQVVVVCQACQGSGAIVHCLECRGQKMTEEKKIIKVEIDKGMKVGKRITFFGESNQEPGCQTGDLIFVLQEKPHPVFKRDGINLMIEKDIPLVNALTGYSFELRHLDGRDIVISIPGGDIIKPNDIREAPELGMPIYTRPFQFGTLYIKFNVLFPNSLSQTQLKAILSYIPGAAPDPPITDLTNVVVCESVDPNKRKQQKEEDDGHQQDENHNKVQCSQQ